MHDDLDLGIAQLKGLGGHLSSSDRELLLQTSAAPLDVERMGERADAYQLLWLVYHKLAAVWVDPRDRVWVRATRLGIAVAREAA